MSDDNGLCIEDTGNPFDRSHLTPEGGTLHFKAKAVCKGDRTEHCWHGTGTILTSHPPKIPEYCCYCGQERIQPPMAQSQSAHGEFYRGRPD